MDSYGIGEGAAHVPQVAPFALPSQIPPEEDESEWEYEYSNTETETFYVTLDLSKADFTDRDASSVNRQGYRGNEKADRAKLYLNRRISPDNSFGNNSPNDSDDEDEEPRNSPAQQPTDDNPDDHQVQIMELHSQNPIISYKGRVYQGNWSQNVGTEFLMTKRDDDNPLPVIQHLDHDIELLAASCARITVDEIQVKPQEWTNRRRRNVNFTKEANAMRPIVPPAERWSTQTRRDQGNFLASLIELKKRKGETDEVTVIAKGIDLRVNHNRNRKRRGLRQGHRGKFNLPHVRGPRKIRGDDLLRTLMIRETDDGAPSGPSSGMLQQSPGEEEEEGGISTPTPLHWADLERREDEDVGDDSEAMYGVNGEEYDNEEEEYEGEEEDMDEIGYSGSDEEGSVDEMDVDED